MAAISSLSCPVTIQGLHPGREILDAHCVLCSVAFNTAWNHIAEGIALTIINTVKPVVRICSKVSFLLDHIRRYSAAIVAILFCKFAHLLFAQMPAEPASFRPVLHLSKQYIEHSFARGQAIGLPDKVGCLAPAALGISAAEIAPKNYDLVSATTLTKPGYIGVIALGALNNAKRAIGVANLILGTPAPTALGVSTPKRPPAYSNHLAAGATAKPPGTTAMGCAIAPNDRKAAMGIPSLVNKGAHSLPPCRNYQYSAIIPRITLVVKSLLGGM